MNKLKLISSAAAFLMALWSVYSLHSHKHLTASLMAILLYVLATVFMLFKGLSSAKIDLDDKSLELGSDKKRSE